MMPMRTEFGDDGDLLPAKILGSCSLDTQSRYPIWVCCDSLLSIDVEVDVDVDAMIQS